MNYELPIGNLEEYINNFIGIMHVGVVGFSVIDAGFAAGQSVAEVAAEAVASGVESVKSGASWLLSVLPENIASAASAVGEMVPDIQL